MKNPSVRDSGRTIAPVAALAVLGFHTHLQAVPYASGVNQVNDTVGFTLNEPADTVTITRDGGSAIVMNAAAAGRHSFDMTGFSSYTISVTHSAPVGWTESPISIGNAMLGFERANGVAVNNNPGSPNFGRFYVSQRDATTSFLGRQMGDGIYVFNADATDAFGITDPNDTSAARNAGLDFSATPASPFRISVGPDDTLYISDASDVHGGIYYADPDVTTGGNLLAGLGGVRPIVGQNHGSILSTPLISGSLAGGDLVLYTIDQDLPGSVPDTGRHVWRYDIGSTANFAGAPTLALDASTLGNNSDGSPILSDTNSGNFDLNTDSGNLADITRDPRTGNFIIMQTNTGLGGLVIMDPTMSSILFNSRQFELDHESSLLLRNINSAAVSPDGKHIVVRLIFSTVQLLFPLDDNGIPVLDPDAVDLGATVLPAPPSYPGAPRAPIDFDLAGNIYTAGNSFGGGERLGIYSPGGDSVAITRSDGTFTINGLTYGDHLAGDLDGDGFVGIGDLNLVLGNWNQNVTQGVLLQGDPSGDGFVGIEDLNVVLGNWNAGTPPGDAANIPEPGAGAVALLGLSAAGGLGRRRRTIADL